MPSRKEFLIEKFGFALCVALKGREGKSLSKPRAVQLFLDSDPSSKKKFSTWLVTSYLRDGFKLEDLSRAKSNLILFEKWTRRLPVDKRDISTYHSLADLWVAVKPFVQSDEATSNKDQQRKLKEQAREESVILAEDDTWSVAIPLTEFAAKWLGQGTQWCTSADKDNAFQYYNYNGPLVVIDMRAEGKFQILASAYGIPQFNDANDKPVRSKTIEKHFHRWKPILSAVVDLSAEFYKLIPPARRDKALSMAAVRQDGQAIAHVPKNLIDSEMFKLALKSADEILEHLPSEKRTKEICDLAVEKNPVALKFVPEEHIDYRMCVSAVERDGSSLEWVPDQFKTDTIFRAALANKGDVLWVVSRNARTPEICAIALANDPMAISAIPDEIITAEMCCAAFESNLDTFSLIPKRFLSAEFCEKAFSRGVPLSRIPGAFVNDAMRMLEVKRNIHYFERLAHNLKTPEMCWFAVEQQGILLKYVPEELMDRDLCRTALLTSGCSLKHVPWKHRTEELCLIAVTQNGYALEDVPLKFKTRKLCMAAAKSTPRCLPYIPKPYLDRDMFEAFLSVDGAMLKAHRNFVQSVDRDMCLLAVSQNGLALAHVPERFVDLEMCSVAVKNRKKALAYVPAAIKERNPGFENDWMEHDSGTEIFDGEAVIEALEPPPWLVQGTIVQILRKHLGTFLVDQNEISDQAAC